MNGSLQSSRYTKKSLSDFPSEGLFFQKDEDLVRLLPENCKDAYDAFKAAYDEMYAMAEKEAFADGFSLGLRLGIESYGRETEFAKDGV